VINCIYYIKRVAELTDVGDTAYAMSHAAAEPSVTVESGVLRMAGCQPARAWSRVSACSM